MDMYTKHWTTNNKLLGPGSLGPLGVRFCNTSALIIAPKRGATQEIGYADKDARLSNECGAEVWSPEASLFYISNEQQHIYMIYIPL